MDEDDEDILSREDIQEIVLAVCGVLFDFGIKEIHIGGLMRVVGVEEEKAQQHDNERMILDQEFEDTYSAYVASLDAQEHTIDIKIPPGTTLH